ncbi:MAG TPA: hypothetical protein VFB33_00245 [Candidatus Binataceae bacterium]|nr:hypothetical protein [Candidatus Binataceae bacterium]
MWRKRCLVIVPVVGFVASALLLSCGGGSSNPIPLPTATPVTLVGVRICSKFPSATAACPVPTPVGVDISTTFGLFAQGQFSSNGVISYEDITQNANWFSNSSAVTISEPQPTTTPIREEFTAGPAAGCACITVASGSLVSAPLKVTVIDPSASPTATPCPPCPPF